MKIFWKVKDMEEISIKSKSKFDDDFFGQIETLIEKLDNMVSGNIGKKYSVEYTNYSNNSIKIKINDNQKSIFKLIHCKLTYKQNDINFWYIHPEILSDVKWQKTITHKLEKFNIVDHKKILDSISEKLIEVIEEY